MERSAVQALLPAGVKPRFVDEFLEHYLHHGFGSLGKRDVDILVMHLLCKYAGLEMKPNNELSQLLQLTESKVRSLRYEAKLKYPPQEEHHVERRFLWALAMSQFDAERQSVKFVVGLQVHPELRRYAEVPAQAASAP